MQQLNRAAKMIRSMKQGYREHGSGPDGPTKKGHIFFPRLSKRQPVKVMQITDAGEPNDDGLYRGKWLGAIGIGVQEWDDDEDVWSVDGGHGCGQMQIRSSS